MTNIYDNGIDRLTGQYVNLSGIKSLNYTYKYGKTEFGENFGDAIYGVSLNGTPNLSYDYDYLGRLSERKLVVTDNEFTTRYFYEEIGENGTSPLVTKFTSGEDTYEYAYDELGNITSIKRNGAVVESYTYDKLNQLQTVTRGEDVWGYTYDNGGNIASVTRNGETEKSYTYGDSEWKDLLTSYNGQTITYDQIGNPLQYRDGMAFTWQNGRQLATITNGTNSISYTYDASGLRTSKTVNGVTTDYYWLNGVLQAQKTGDEYIIFLYDEAGSAYGMILKNGAAEEYYYYVYNLQGDVIGIVDSAGNTVVSYSYSAWGEVESVTGTQASTIGQKNPIRYRRYYYDGETGFYYVSSRYYDPEIGRWINADIPETLTADFENFAQYNLFAYCFNNPINMSDETGTWPSWAKKVVAAVAVVAVVATVAAVTVATAGAGTAAAVIAVGAAKGAAIGMATGAAIGAGSGAVNHRISTGSWRGAGTAALNGMGDGALSGAITGAVTGAARRAIKVGQAARAWDASSKGGSWTNMSNHYSKHVLQEGKKSMTRNVITYTNDAKALWINNNGVGKLMSSGSLRLKGLGVGGFYSPSGLIRSFFYQ